MCCERNHLYLFFAATSGSEPTPHQEEGEFRPSVAGKFLGLHLHEERKLFLTMKKVLNIQLIR
jgi:hypothetical protein